MAETKTADYRDVVILGGGLAGLSLGIQLKQRLPELSIAIIERNSHPVASAAHKVGESTVELSSHYFADILDLKEHLTEHQLPKLGLRFFFKNETKTHTPLEEQVEFGARTFPHSPSYQLDRGIFENYLAEKCLEMGIEFIDNHKVTGLDIHKGDAPHSATFTSLSTDKSSTLHCKWLVDACSRHSPIKRELGLARDSEHKVSSAWFRLETKLDVNDFSPDQGWQNKHEGDLSRWFSTNHFMGKGYWVWVIPLSSGSTSIGIVADNSYHDLETYNTFDKAMDWLEAHEPICYKAIKDKSEKLQDFRVLRNFSHDAKRVFSKDRWFLTGEAGVFLDPFYSPGSDFIGISNTFISNMIELDLADPDSFHYVSRMLNLVYLNMFQNTMLIYQNQYAVFGHPKIMPIKILWDFAVYWTFLSYLFIQGAFKNLDIFLSLRDKLDIIGRINEKMQPFMLAWSSLESQDASPIYIDPFDFPLLSELNKNLYAEQPEEAIIPTFDNNLEQLKRFAGEILDAAAQRHPELSIPKLDVIYPEAENSILSLLEKLDVSLKPAA